jgi:hypothetical protein
VQSSGVEVWLLANSQTETMKAAAATGSLDGHLKVPA